MVPLNVTNLHKTIITRDDDEGGQRGGTSRPHEVPLPLSLPLSGHNAA